MRTPVLMPSSLLPLSAAASVAAGSDRGRDAVAVTGVRGRAAG